MSIEDRVKGIFKKVLDIKPEEIKLDSKLDQSLGVDSTEMVEISVSLKKEFGVPIAGTQVKKTHSLSEIINILKSKGVT